MDQHIWELFDFAEHITDVLSTNSIGYIEDFIPQTTATSVSLRIFVKPNKQTIIPIVLTRNFNERNTQIVIDKHTIYVSANSIEEIAKKVVKLIQ